MQGFQICLVLREEGGDEVVGVDIALGPCVAAAFDGIKVHFGPLCTGTIAFLEEAKAGSDVFRGGVDLAGASIFFDPEIDSLVGSEDGQETLVEAGPGKDGVFRAVHDEH